MELTPRDFNDLRGYIYELCGLHIPDNKEYLITQRLKGLLRAAEVESWRELYEFLRRDCSPQVRNEVISAITTNETSFFRDQHPFDSFREHLLPELCRRSVARRLSGDKTPVRIWSAAAATGQEAYTLAMIIQDHLERTPCSGLRPADFQILGTDISARVLGKATKAEYSDFELSRGLPEAYRKYFERAGNCWRVRPELRSMVEFRQRNLVVDFSNLKTFDVIFCRNVLIYFDQATKCSILERFSKILHPGCHLILGSTESVYGLSDAFCQERVGKAIFYRLKGPGC
ncbi:MAG: protein-glutamate O-methyltransferase CheR [Desulfovibrio sp.]